MKRRLLTLLFVLMILPCVFLLTACTTNVAGKTYEFESVKAEVSSDISDENLSNLAVSVGLSASASRKEVEEKLNKQLQTFVDAFKDKENYATFKTDGTMIVVTNDVEKDYVWSQKGSVVTVNEVFEDGTVDGGNSQELKVVSASRISVNLDGMSGDGYTIKMYYKLAA